MLNRIIPDFYPVRTIFTSSLRFHRQFQNQYQ
jgi:hypothetical protein